MAKTNQVIVNWRRHTDLDKSLLGISEACPAHHLQPQGSCQEVDSCLISTRQVLQPLSIGSAEAEEDGHAATGCASAPDTACSKTNRISQLPWLHTFTYEDAAQVIHKSKSVTGMPYALNECLPGKCHVVQLVQNEGAGTPHKLRNTLESGAQVLSIPSNKPFNNHAPKSKDGMVLTNIKSE